MSEVILGIDTSTQVCVGLARGGEAVFSESTGDSRSHVELLMSTVKSVMKTTKTRRSKLTGIAVGMGPGPYTGLRVGIVAAQMLSKALDIPVYHRCSLDVLGVGWALTYPQGPFIACTDARRKELYWAVYDRHGRRTEGPYVSSCDQIPPLSCVGPGVLAPHADVRVDPFLTIKLGVRIDPFEPWPRPEEVSDIVGIDAGLLAAYVHELPDAGPEPLYLRHADADEPGKAKSVLPEVR